MRKTSGPQASSTNSDYAFGYLSCRSSDDLGSLRDADSEKQGRSSCRMAALIETSWRRWACASEGGSWTLLRSGLQMRDGARSRFLHSKVHAYRSQSSSFSPTLACVRLEIAVESACPRSSSSELDRAVAGARGHCGDAELPSCLRSPGAS